VHILALLFPSNIPQVSVNAITKEKEIGRKIVQRIDPISLGHQPHGASLNGRHSIIV
jgi:hypothetical protein